MSRYPPPQDFRGRDRSRSPPRFADRRASAASIFDNRPPGPARSASDAPRGPRFDGPRPLPPGGPAAGSAARPAYPSLRDAPPLGSGDRGRPFRERDYDRRDRIPSPRERSPRALKDTRDYPPRDLEIPRQRRGSRDGPPPLGSGYPDGPPLSNAPFRGGYSRGRGRGEHPSRGGRGGRGTFDDRELIRRPDRSPPRTWARDLSREGRDADRRDERRFDRREDERRPLEWPDRDRDREFDRSRREPLPPPPRLEGRNSNDSINSANATYQSTQMARPHPERLALIEGAGAESSSRKPSVQQNLPPPPKREPLETPAYLNGRAATTANRYGARGSSSPTQAPPVPAFTLSFAPTASNSAPSNQPTQPSQFAKPRQETKRPSPRPLSSGVDSSKPNDDVRHPPSDAPAAPKAPSLGSRSQLASPPPAAPRGPRAQENDEANASSNRLQQVRSLEGLASQSQSFASPRNGPFGQLQQATAAAPATLPTLIQPVSPRISQASRFGDLAAPTGPRASRTSPAQASVSPRPPFASPRSDASGQQSAMGLPRASTPPLAAPTGPRSRPFSVSPKAAPPTAPNAFRNSRVPPLAPRGLDRGTIPPTRGPDRLGTSQSLQPPSAPRASQWNQWKRPGGPTYNDKTVPAKRDIYGEEKARVEDQAQAGGVLPTSKNEDSMRGMPSAPLLRTERSVEEEMDIDKQPAKRHSLISGHSAAQSFFGKPTEISEEDDNDTGMSEAGQDVPSTSEDDESDTEEINLELFKAKYDRRMRELEAKITDLSQPRYRAMSPLETISRLLRISMRDIQKFKEERERDMEIDNSPIMQSHHLPPRTARSSDSVDGPDLLTPQGEENQRVAICGSDDGSEEVRRVRRPTPELILLPYLLKDGVKPFHESSSFKEQIKRHEQNEADLLDAMEDELHVEEDACDEVEQTFADEYRRWREECEELERIREEQEKLERQQSIEPGPEPDAPMIAPQNAFEGGSRRLHKFSSEYDFVQVLKQSEETARIEQERQDRETKKNQADMEKEAKIPSLLTDDEIRRGTFVDTNRFRDPESLTMVFSYEPPTDNFTDSEQQIFIAAFKETPKKWGEIASLLPGRTYEDCIRHYYTNKWDSRFRDNRTKKLKAGGRRGRGGARGPRGRMGGLMADLARAEDILSIEAMSEKGRPRRAAAPTTFGEKEAESKANLLGQSPAKKPGPNGKADTQSEGVPEKPGKRQKRTGEKPGRKAKNTQPLAALAAAPHGSPAKQFMQREDQARAQKLEDANLLASLQAGHGHDGLAASMEQLVYAHPRYMASLGGPEEPDRSKSSGQAPVAKHSASSYWSVPEQQDFVKYIGHFGRDFAAIAAHMGTKTQTMIKNHYMRQIEGGNKPELERAASEAEDRKARGEEIGPPPTPTPIQKRKYESVPSSTQRQLAPHADAMEVDEPAVTSRVQIPKHASPPQHHPQPRITSSSQNTPIPAPRVALSPHTATAAPAQPQIPASLLGKSTQHPMGSRLTFMPDSRPESRQATHAPLGFRVSDEPQRSLSQQANRPLTDARDPSFLSSLFQEQQRAIRLQEQQTQPERVEHLQRQTNMQRNLSQGSPLNQALHQPPDRKPIAEERPPTPPRSGFGSSTFPRSSLGSSNFGLGPTPFTSLAGRSAFNYSPPSQPKREEARPPSLSSLPPAAAPQSSVAPLEPKRSTVMSLLNDDEPQPPKRESLPSVMQRTSSPAHQSHGQGTSSAPGSALPGMRREPSFGQASMPQSQFGRGPFGQQSSNSPSGPPTPQHEHGIGGGSISHTPKSDWTTRLLGHNEPQRQTNPTLEREVRPYYQHNGHRSLLGSLGQPRANPSPPPLGSITHSRTPSLTTLPGQQGRDAPQSSLLSQQPHTQALSSNPYASQSLPSFSQPPSTQAQNHAHHAHNVSLSGPLSDSHHRAVSRDEQYRQEQREREDREARWRQQEYRDQDRRREEERYMRQEQERQQAALHRHPPQPLEPPQPPPFGGQPFAASRNLDLRRQSQMEGELAMREEQDRQEMERRRHELIQRERDEEYRRRAQEDAMFRRTPLRGGYGAPPPPGQRR